MPPKRSAARKVDEASDPKKKPARKSAGKKSSKKTALKSSGTGPNSKNRLKELKDDFEHAHTTTKSSLKELLKNVKTHGLETYEELRDMQQEATSAMRKHLTDFTEHMAMQFHLPPKNEIGTPGGNAQFNKILRDFKVITDSQTFTGFVFNDIGNHLLTPYVPRVEPSVHMEPPVNPTYETCRLMHNRRFDFRPWVIVYPKSTEEVSWCVILAKLLNREIRIRSGAHDHAGESNATDALLLDCSALRELQYTPKDAEGGLIKMGPGWKFLELFRQLGQMPETRELEIAIPHGTCQSVGVAGYLFGGGWGPYTRRYGMCCESLVGATIVLGDGEIVELSDDAPNDANKLRNDELLWAIRGGGGPSYGVVTSMTIRAFNIADTHNYTFLVHWNVPDHEPTTPTIDVLASWQDLLIKDTDDPDCYLTGTNMQITAVHSKPIDEAQAQSAMLEVQFYGYMQSKRKWTECEFQELILTKWFPTCKPNPEDIELHRVEGMVTQLFSSWARQGKSCTKRHLADNKARFEAALKKSGVKPTLMKNPQTGDDEWPIQVEYLLEEDRPDPHMITSRMCASKNGLNRDQFTFFIQTLHSELLPTKEDIEHAKKDPVMGRNPVATYCNFNGIAGPWYRDPANNASSVQRCSYPYQDSAYVIQYQTWWEAAAVDNQRLHNRAMDWIQENAKKVWPCGGVKGSFISFKSSEVPESEYFQQNYQRLINIKNEYSKDETNILRSRKSII